METSIGKLSIRCIEVDEKYDLQFEGSDWVESLPSMEAALRHAGELVAEETQVFAYDSAGQGLVVTTLFPRTEAVTQTPQATGEGGKEAFGKDLAELKRALATKGVRGAVAFLNSRTPHRFTSLFRFDGPALRAITFYDRHNPTMESFEDISVEESYCVFVRDRGENFAVSDSCEDERVKDHPKRATVKRYCGVPLLDQAGKMFGSICHFDFEPGRIDDREVELLERMAELLRPGFR